MGNISGASTPSDLTHVTKTITFIGGTANAAVTTAAGYLQDTRLALDVDAYIGVTINCDGKTGVVTSNTAVRLNVASWTGGTPTTGSAWTADGHGAIGNTATLFTLTGRVLVERGTMYGAGLVNAGSAAKISLGNTIVPTGIANNSIAIPTGFTGFVGPGYYDAGGGPDMISSGGGYYSAGSGVNAVAITESVLAAITVAAITAGTLTVDLWYRPITANGALVAA